MADYFHGGADALTEQMARESIFPPMFPFMLSAFGAGTETISTAHMVVVLALLLTCAVCFWWLSLHQVTVNERLMGTDDCVLVVITGSGLKDTQAALRAGGHPLRMAPDINALEEALRIGG